MRPRRTVDAQAGFGRPLLQQLRRLLFLLAVGYLLQLPGFNFAKLVHTATRAEWLAFYQADVLQCIAVTLFVLVALRLVLRSEQRLYAALTVIALGLVFVSPAVWSLDALALAPAPIAQYLNGRHGSRFPLFPWSAFLLAGAVCGYGFTQASLHAGWGSQQQTETRFMRRTTAVGAVLIVVALLAEWSAATRHGVPGYWRYSPSFFGLRLGIVMVLCAAMYFYERRRGVAARSAVTLLGRQSLLVYATHLLLIFGTVGTVGFSRWVDASYGYGEALLAALILIALMYLLAFGWAWLRRQHPRLKLGVQLGALVVAAGVLFLRRPPR